jgi:LysR family glycine cleavage system transcriptional activator
VRALELELGVALFRRTPQRVTLTAEGQAWAAELTTVFGHLREANRRLRAPLAPMRPAVALSIIPSFAARWLVPRLGRFLVAHPELDVRVSASERLVDFGAEPVDIAIRYGLGAYPGLSTRKLVDDAFLVVAATSVAQRHARWQLKDLASENLVHDDYPEAWARWFHAAGGKLPTSVRQTQLTDSSMLVEAAVRGHGVALARWSLVADELAAGRVRQLFPKVPPLATGLAYFVVSPRENLRRKPVAAFRDWVLQEAKSLALPLVAEGIAG